MPDIEIVPILDWRGKLAEAKGLIAKVRAVTPESPAEEKAHVVEWIQQAKKLQAEAAELQTASNDMMDLSKKLENTQQGGSPRQDDQRKSTFANWNNFLVAAYNASVNPDRKDARLVAMKDFDPEDRLGNKHEEKDLAEGVGSTGGFLVPAEFQAQLMAVMANTSVVRSRATKIRMTRRQLSIPVLDQTGTTAGQPHWFGGMQAYWQAEASEKTQSDPAFRLIDLVAHKLIMYTRASDELLDDAAVSLSDFLSGPMGFAGAIAWMEDYAFLQGNGAGQPLGVINAAATITVARVDQDNVTYDDLVTMIENFMPSADGLWVLSQSVMTNLLLMNGPSGNPSYIWGNATTGVPNTLLGYPVEWSEKVPRISTTSVGDVGLYDFKYYLIGDRQATTVESTKYDRWRYDQTSWRAVHRVDGQPWLSTPLTYQDGTTQVSPFVILGAKST